MDNSGIKFGHGLSVIERGEKFYITDRNGQNIEGCPFDDAFVISEKLVALMKDEKYNFIDANGNLILPWCDDYNYVDKNTIVVKVSDCTFELLDTDGNFLNDGWKIFLDGDPSYNIIKLGGKFNMVDDEGKLMMPTWVDEIYAVTKDGWRRVRAGVYFNYVNCIRGGLLSNEWFDDIYEDVFTPFRRVKIDGKWNYIDKKGNYLMNVWVDYAGRFDNGFARIQIKGRDAIVYDDGRIEYDDELHEALSCDGGFRRTGGHEHANTQRCLFVKKMPRRMY